MGEAVLTLSYAAIWALAALEAAVVLQLVRRVVRLKSEMDDPVPDPARHERLAAGTFVDFAARDLVGGGLVRSAELRGAPTTLLFLGAEPVVSEDPGWLLGTVAGLRDKGEGRLLVLCDGGWAACSELSRLAGPELTVLDDAGGEIRRRFLVHSTPAAVLLDADASVAMYGRPEQSSDQEKEV